MSYSCPFFFLSLSICPGQDPGTVCSCGQLQTPRLSFSGWLPGRDGVRSGAPGALRDEKAAELGGALRDELAFSLGTFHLVFEIAPW